MVIHDFCSLLMQECRGPDNRPGYDRIQHLASYLVSLREKLALTIGDVSKIQELFANLADFDKDPFVCQPFPKPINIRKGGFKKPKGKYVPLGVEVAKR